jgi:Domain of unknown function (DUF5658)
MQTHFSRDLAHMSDHSRIERTDAMWNPIQSCTNESCSRLKFPVVKPKKRLGIQALARSDETTRASRFRGNIGSRLIHASFRESSLVGWESLGLIVLSLADLLVTYTLLRRGPAFYESNPVAQWFFARWNIAGMALFKLGTMGFVIVIAEIVERRRQAWGRGLLLASCLATAAVAAYGLRVLLGHGDNGVPLQ